MLLLYVCTLVLLIHIIGSVHVTAGSVTKPQLSSSPTDGPQQQLVFFDHDGGVDDFITMLLLLSNPQKANIIGITILDGDCHADVAANTTLKLLHLLNRPHIPVAVSTLAAANPFPAAYRSQGLILDVLPILNHNSPPDLAALTDRQLQQQPGQEFFAQTLLQQTQKVTVIATGPLANLAYALDKYPQVAGKIERVWWMGGALRVRGNVYEPHTDGSAEWNAFWDPAAMGSVWRSNVPLTLVPLDGTNKVPITPDLVYSFGPQSHHLYSALAGTFYAPVVNWVYSTPGEPYYAWDALTAACMMEPALCKVETDLQVAAVLSGPAQGATVLVGQPPVITGPAGAAEAHQEHQQETTASQPQAQSIAESSWGSSVLSSVQRVLLGRLNPDSSSAFWTSAVTAEPAASGTSKQPAPGGAAGNSKSVFSAQGSDVSRHMSAVKSVAAVVDVDTREFHQYILRSLQK